MPRVFAEYNEVVIRSWKPDDADDYFRIVGDTQAMRFISGGRPRSLTDARAEVATFVDELDTRGWSRFAVSLGVDGPFLGYSGFAMKSDGIDFGGRSLRQYWGKSYTTIGCWLALDYGMTVVGFESVYTSIHVENYRALRMTSRLGFTQQKIIETSLGPHSWLGLHRADYEAGIREQNAQLIDRLFSRHEVGPPGSGGGVRAA